MLWLTLLQPAPAVPKHGNGESSRAKGFYLWNFTAIVFYLAFIFPAPPGRGRASLVLRALRRSAAHAALPSARCAPRATRTSRRRRRSASGQLPGAVAIINLVAPTRDPGGGGTSVMENWRRTWAVQVTARMQVCPERGYSRARCLAALVFKTLASEPPAGTLCLFTDLCKAQWDTPPSRCLVPALQLFAVAMGTG